LIVATILKEFFFHQRRDLLFKFCECDILDWEFVEESRVVEIVQSTEIRNY